MSDAHPDDDAVAGNPAPSAGLMPPTDPPLSPAPAERRPAPHARVNPLAVAALILGVLLSPLAAVFGHIAAGQISRSRGTERGLAIAWVAVGLGYLWLVALIVLAGAVWVGLGR